MAGGSLGVAVLFFPLAVALLLIVAHALLQTRVRGWQRHVPAGRASIPENLRRTAPFGQIELLRHMATRIDVVLLQFIAGAAATGIYSAAYRVVFSIQFLPHLAQLSLFPVASKLFTESREELTHLYTTAMRVAVLLTVPAVAGVWLVATPLVRVAFGEDFDEAVPVLRVLAPFLIVISFKHLAGMFLMACDLEGKNTKGQWLGSILNVIGNVSLIPVLGPVGAALATIVSESVGVVYFFLHLRPILGWPQLSSRLALALVGSAAFLLPGVFLPGLSLWIIVPAAALVYAGVLLSFRSVREEEIKMLSRSIRTLKRR